MKENSVLKKQKSNVKQVKPAKTMKISKRKKMKALKKNASVRGFTVSTLDDDVLIGNNPSEQELHKQKTVDEESVEVESDGAESDKDMSDNEGSERAVSTDDEMEDQQDTTQSIPSSALPGTSGSMEMLTSTTYESLRGKISDKTLQAVHEMGFTHMTKIQEQALPHLLEGKDLVGAAKTGSGKTLAYLIPAIELLYKVKFKFWCGTGVIIIAPTRELSMQIYTVLRELVQHHNKTIGLVIGGTKWQTEREKLAKGINILVASPGRLADHLQNSPEFVFKNLQCLIIDEADRVLDAGFADEVKQIIDILPKRRQTILLSATLNKQTEDLIALVMKDKEPLYVGVDDEAEEATVEGLQQGYVVCPTDKRFLLLFTFLKRNRGKKVMVFLSSCLSVKFHHELLNYIDLPVMCLHGKQNQATRTSVFFKFCSAESGTLLCTNVGARGLDIPAVDWIVQYDPPDDPKEYIHRVGRTARGLNGQGNALLILQPEELGFLHYLKEAKVPITEYEFAWSKISNIQLQLEKLISSNYYLCMASKDAYKACVRAYVSHSMKQIFNVHKLDLVQLAKSFGLTIAPHVTLDVGNPNRFSNERHGAPKKKAFQRPIKYRIQPVGGKKK